MCGLCVLSVFLSSRRHTNLCHCRFQLTMKDEVSSAHIGFLYSAGTRILLSAMRQLHAGPSVGLNHGHCRSSRGARIRPWSQPSRTFDSTRFCERPSVAHAACEGLLLTLLAPQFIRCNCTTFVARDSDFSSELRLTLPRIDSGDHSAIVYES